MIGHLFREILADFGLPFEFGGSLSFSNLGSRNVTRNFFWPKIIIFIRGLHLNLKLFDKVLTLGNVSTLCVVGTNITQC